MWDAIGWVVFTILFFGFFYCIADAYWFVRVVLPSRRKAGRDNGSLINEAGVYNYYHNANRDFENETPVETARDRKSILARLKRF